jgi:hypothetical protein
MRFIHHVLVSLILTFSLGTAAQDILVMDTIEFNTVRHDEGKRKYVLKLTEILKKMRLKTDNFDAMNSDQHEIYELIQSNERWTKINAKIEKVCRERAQKRNCNALTKLRLDTFDFIKNNPQNYAPELEEPQAMR